MKHSTLIVYMAVFLYPFMLVFGIYVILFGDSSPGGGFQGGAILASAYIASYIAGGESEVSLEVLLKLEKLLYMVILLSCMVSLLTKGSAFTNFIPAKLGLGPRRLFLVLLNVLIGFKVALGITSIFSAFTRGDM